MNNARYVMAKDLRPGDYVLRHDRILQVLESVEPLPKFRRHVCFTFNYGSQEFDSAHVHMLPDAAVVVVDL